MGKMRCYRTIEVYGKDVPFGAYLESDLLDNGTLVLRKGTFIDSDIKRRLSNYGHILKVSIETDDKILQENNRGDTVEDEKALIFDIEIKERALQGVEYMYNNPGNKESIAAAKDVSNIITQAVRKSSSTNISLKELKVSDEYTFKHCVDVATMGTLVGQSLKLRQIDIESIATAGILHDLGKVSVPLEILNKPGKLTDEEFNIIKQHPVYGYNLIKNNNDLSETTKMGILMHHEKVNGTGYPLRLTSNKIHFAGKLLSVVDVFDALVTKRPYRDNIIEPATAIEMMMGMSDQFDIEILRAFLNCVILYPINSFVILSNGRTYKVVGQNIGYPLRPVLLDIDTNKKIDLLHDTGCYCLTISKGIVL